MRVAELYQHRSFRLIEQEIADPTPGEIQVQVHAVGICGSDLHNFSEGGVGDVSSQYPQVLGHEPTGTVLKVGAGVTGWQPGDRAALEPAIYCYHCHFCMTGHHNVCENIRFLSMPGDPGYLRDKVNLPAINLLPLAPEIDFAVGTLFEPLAVVLHSMKFVNLRPGETAVVFGGGPIGLLTVAVLRLSGARRIWCVEPVAERRELAKNLGADAALDPKAIDVVRQLYADTGNMGVDVAIDCATKGETINQCIGATRNAGRLVITGIPSESRVNLDFHTMRRKELALLNVRRSCHESEAALEMLREQPGRFAPMLTHTWPLEKVQTAFETLEQYADGVGKVLIQV
jgi:L-iditol 2-dehydrogenase